ncbi:hypothetical protein Rhopal_007304-T1 [Rhodotorula paludigena]|uniref:Proteophosphoglycan ppg4 n=1 Tax=Rhodotorula paludigena TaxID=86838 RepID=A0AAV5GXP0_9BASI|nr:hypothetical protein Rhopal_007304-T1 [Rhodotorula paludigena]
MPSRFPFLRRSSSATDVNDFPAAPSSTSSFFSPGSRAVPLLKSRKLLANPSASASTNDLPSLVAQPGPPSASPRPTRAPTFELGAAGALGPKAGARLLASQEAQRAIQLAADAQTDDFDMHERLERDELTGDRAVSRDAKVQTQQGRRVQHSSSGSRSGSGSSAAIRRVPVPALDDVALVDMGAQQRSHRETSLQQLTRRASEEEREGRDAEAARRRNASLSKASVAGLGSPFASPAAHAPPNKPARRPPIAGLNRAGDADEQGGRVLSAGGPSAPRQRTASGGSTASVSKDMVLAQLGEAVRRERKKAEMYERECEQGQKELAEITTNLDVLREKFETILMQQQQTMSNLRAEIDEMQDELERANDLDNDEKPQKRSPLAFRRGRSLKRRVDEHVATYDTVANVQVAKPPLPRSALSLATLPTPNDPRDLRRHQSKLSESRTIPTRSAERRLHPRQSSARYSPA